MKSWSLEVLFVFVLMDAILPKLDLQKRTTVLDNPPNENLFVLQNASYIQNLEFILNFQ